MGCTAAHQHALSSLQQGSMRCAAEQPHTSMRCAVYMVACAAQLSSLQSGSMRCAAEQPHTSMHCAVCNMAACVAQLSSLQHGSTRCAACSMVAWPVRSCPGRGGFGLGGNKRPTLLLADPSSWRIVWGGAAWLTAAQPSLLLLTGRQVDSCRPNTAAAARRPLEVTVWCVKEFARLVCLR